VRATARTTSRRSFGLSGSDPFGIDPIMNE
jgi:hypothetical protein